MIDPHERMRSVELVSYNPEWPNLFSIAADEIKRILRDNCVEVYHIGSTAIPHIHAKPIIDILPIVKNLQHIDSLNHEFEALGYTCMGEYGIPGRRFYWRSKTNRTHNIHVFAEDSAEIARHLSFMNFMKSHSDYAAAYSLIKQNLAAVFPFDIENYVNGKSSFVQYIDYKTGTAPASQLHAEDNIIIEAANPAWSKLAAAEIQSINTLAKHCHYDCIEHIGSTAVADLASKPIIDLIIGIPSLTAAPQWITLLETLGYVYWNENPDKLHLRFFKGMPPFGRKRSHHIHIVETNNSQVAQRILFRDILRNSSAIRQAYAKLKFDLARAHTTDREAYTDNKSDFIHKVLQQHGCK